MHTIAIIIEVNQRKTEDIRRKKHVSFADIHQLMKNVNSVLLVVIK